MLKPGDKIIITDSDGKQLSVSSGWTVVIYNDGLIKVKRKGTSGEEVLIYNMRSTSFHSVEYQLE